MADAPAEIAPGVHRVGHPLVNCYLLDDGGGLTLVDAGLAGFRGQLEGYLRTLGRGLGDIEAVVLTHAHSDHVGMADGVRRDAGARVLVHAGDAEMARTAKPHKREASMLPYLRNGAAWRLFGAFARYGGVK